MTVSGVPQTWHNITLTLDGPFAYEGDNDPNPFKDYRFTVTFTHLTSQRTHVVPGYFAADGNAGNSSAESGTKWRAHLSPDKTGRWTYEISFQQGPNAALETDQSTGSPVLPFHGQKGSFAIIPSDKDGSDFRGRGRLEYVGGHYLRFAGDGEYFLKAGSDSPETLLAFEDFDGTAARKTGAPLKTWAPHLKDWRPGDPDWKDGMGRGLVGALNYLEAKGINAISFLTYNAGGDGDNVWPFVEREAKFHYDCSKLDQWGIVFDHAQARGIFLHFKLQEQENDDRRRGSHGILAKIPEALDKGTTGTERKLYLRELIARFGHALALNWNLGEENTQSTEEQRSMAQYIRDVDPYDHPIVMHTYPDQQDQVYAPLLGELSMLTGASLQMRWDAGHAGTLHWRRESVKAGKPWVVCHDEQNPSESGVPPDPGFNGFDGTAQDADTTYDLHDIRRKTLWGTFLAGGAGVEYYFGYRLPENDLLCEDFRSRDRTWDYCRIALAFFSNEAIPFWNMDNADALVGNLRNDNSRFCFVKQNELYLVYLTSGGAADLDLSDATGQYSLTWYNPRIGGELIQGSVAQVSGGEIVSLGSPPYHPTEDWLAIARRQ